MSTGKWSVCVYCGSNSNVPESYLRLAADVGTELAARGWGLVWGGAKVSMMGEVARAARAGGASTYGVIPRGLVELEVADPDAGELRVVETMRERKALMDDAADAFLALPGGLGTCEELFEVWTSGYLRMHDKPVVLLDPDDHWAGMVTWIEGLRDRGFVPQAALDALAVVSTVDEALDACAPTG